MAKQLTDTFSKKRVFEYSNGKSIVHYPDLTPEESERRQKKIEKACIRLVMESDRARMEQEKRAQSVG